MSQLFVCLLIFSACLLTICSAIWRSNMIVKSISRRITTPRTAPSVPTSEGFCDDSTPCGWADYDPYTREITARQPNYMCKCKPEQDCHLVEDVTTYSYYIYGCRERNSKLDTNK